MITFAVIWAVGAIVTFFTTLALMTEIYSYAIIIAWCVFAWPVYLVANIVLAIRNP